MSKAILALKEMLREAKADRGRGYHVATLYEAIHVVRKAEKPKKRKAKRHAR